MISKAAGEKSITQKNGKPNTTSIAPKYVSDQLARWNECYKTMYAIKVVFNIFFKSNNDIALLPSVKLCTSKH